MTPEAPSYVRSPTMDRKELIERLEKRAKEDESCAANNRVIAELLAPQMALFNAREAPWNTYAVRMAVDHETSAKRDERYASDLRTVIALLKTEGDAK